MAKILENKTFELEGLEHLLRVLQGEGYHTIAPKAHEGAIMLEEIASADELPAGYVDHLEAGKYRLEQTDSPALFGYTLSPQSWKRFLFPPEVRLWQARRNGTEVELLPENGTAESPHFAFIGVRPCELRAIGIQDRVFINNGHSDPTYKHRRDDLFIVVVNCTHAANTCFCASMETGPQASEGFDLALTEVVTPDRHYFVAEAGSEHGAAVMEQLPCHNTTKEEQKAAVEGVRQAEQQMGRTVKTKGLKDLLTRSYDHTRWDAVANQCLACGNCTMVCPTCFCTTVEDVTDLTGEHAERWRKWDSCFTLDFSYIFGGSVRNSVKARYRQWLTHKMATWNDQFNTMGCVGCGRCIAWCPVGIDITEEIRALQEADSAAPKHKKQRTDDVSA